MSTDETFERLVSVAYEWGVASFEVKTSEGYFKAELTSCADFEPGEEDEVEDETPELFKGLPEPRVSDTEPSNLIPFEPEVIAANRRFEEIAKRMREGAS